MTKRALVGRRIFLTALEKDLCTPPRGYFQNNSDKPGETQLFLTVSRPLLPYLVGGWKRGKQTRGRPIARSRDRRAVSQPSGPQGGKRSIAAHESVRSQCKRRGGVSCRFRDLPEKIVAFLALKPRDLQSAVSVRSRSHGYNSSVYSPE